MNYLDIELIKLIAEYQHVVDKIKLLLEAGANIACKLDRGKTLLHKAAEKGHNETIQLLLDLNIYTREASLTKIKDAYDNTPLHLAARSGHTKAVYILGDHFSANAQNRNGDTALANAYESCASAKTIANYLMSKTDVTISDIGNYTPLYSVIESIPDGIIKAMVEQGVDLTTKNEYGDTPYDQLKEKCDNLLKILKSDHCKS